MDKEEAKKILESITLQVKNKTFEPERRERIFLRRIRRDLKAGFGLAGWESRKLHDIYRRAEFECFKPIITVPRTYIPTLV